MKKSLPLIAFIGLCVCLSLNANAQGVGVNASGNAADPSAILDASSTTKGTLITRMTTSQRDNIANPAIGLQVFNLDTKCLNYYNGTNWFELCGICPLPVQPSVISGSASSCEGTSQTYSVINVAGITYTWTFPSGWTQTAGGTTNSATVTVGSGSGNIQVTPSNLCGSGSARTLAVTSNAIPGAPTAAANTPSKTQIVWNWNTVSGATGYKYSATNNYSGAIDNGASTSYTQTGLSCGNTYTLYVWAYNTCGNSTAATFTQSSSSCCSDGTGGTITHVGGNTIHTFTSSGTFISNCSMNVQVLVVAGGGGGAYNYAGGGGGGGGFLTGTVSVTPTSYAVTVGAGGIGGSGGTPSGTNGGNSVFATITATGGGGGGGGPSTNGLSGGSGGGGTSPSSSGGTAGIGGSGMSGQGHAGGNGVSSYTNAGGGGGGAGAAGPNAQGDNVGGNGGAGLQSSISGSTVYYAGGGGGGGGIAGGSGGIGGGANGNNSGPSNSGTANTGGGGGSGGSQGGNGGSGIVIISYPTP